MKIKAENQVQYLCKDFRRISQITNPALPNFVPGREFGSFQFFGSEEKIKNRFLMLRIALSNRRRYTSFSNEPVNERSAHPSHFFQTFSL